MELFEAKLTLLWKGEKIGQSSSQLRRTNPVHLANPGAQSFASALREFEPKIKTILAS